jgi:hypothetical protein
LNWEIRQRPRPGVNVGHEHRDGQPAELAVGNKSCNDAVLIACWQDVLEILAQEEEIGIPDRFRVGLQAFDGLQDGRRKLDHAEKLAFPRDARRGHMMAMPARLHEIVPRVAVDQSQLSPMVVALDICTPCGAEDIMHTLRNLERIVRAAQPA